MKILVNEMPKKKEACFFYKADIRNGYLIEEYCKLNNKSCSFKNEESIFGGECRCLQVGFGLTRE